MLSRTLTIENEVRRMEKEKCKNHVKEIHICLEKIINSFAQRMEYQGKAADLITLECAQADSIISAVAKQHSSAHAPVWFSSSRRTLLCRTCGISFTNRVIEAARELELL